MDTLMSAEQANIKDSREHTAELYFLNQDF